MADLHQDTNILHLAGAIMEYFLEGIVLLRHWYINPNEKSKKYNSSLLSQLSKAFPSRKWSIKAPAKCKTSSYVLTEICLQ